MEHPEEHLHPLKSLRERVTQRLPSGLVDGLRVPVIGVALVTLVVIPEAVGNPVEQQIVDIR